MKRLKAIASFVSKGAILLDVGTDHGLLLKELFDNNIITCGLASDINILPLNMAKQNLKDYNVSFYLTDGLDNIPLIFDTLVIAGMGGNLIINILKKHILTLKNKHLILSPHKDAYLVRKFLTENGFYIDSEKIIYDYKYYEIISFRYGQKKYNELELHFGPVILNNLDIVSVNKLKKDLEVLCLKMKYDKYYYNLYNNLVSYLETKQVL